MRETTEREGSRERGRRLPSEGTGTVSGLVRARILAWQWPMSMLALAPPWKERERCQCYCYINGGLWSEPFDGFGLLSPIS
jgi:hypothetical protein